MRPNISPPEGVLKLVEVDPATNKIVRVIEELPTTTGNRILMQRTRNDILMVSPKANLQVRENNA